MIVLFIRARLEHVAELSLPKGYTYTVTVRLHHFWTPVALSETSNTFL